MEPVEKVEGLLRGRQAEISMAEIVWALANSIVTMPTPLKSPAPCRLQEYLVGLWVKRLEELRGTMGSNCGQASRILEGVLAELRRAKCRARGDAYSEVEDSSRNLKHIIEVLGGAIEAAKTQGRRRRGRERDCFTSLVEALEEVRGEAEDATILFDTSGISGAKAFLEEGGARERIRELIDALRGGGEAKAALLIAAIAYAASLGHQLADAYYQFLRRYLCLPSRPVLYDVLALIYELLGVAGAGSTSVQLKPDELGWLINKVIVILGGKACTTPR